MVWPFNTDDLIELTGRAGLTVFMFLKCVSDYCTALTQHWFFTVIITSTRFALRNNDTTCFTLNKHYELEQGESWNFINRFDPTTFLCLSKVCTWISKDICFMVFLCSMIWGDVVACFFDIGGIVDHQCITFLFNDMELRNFYFCPFRIKYLMEKQHIPKLSLWSDRRTRYLLYF
jgi:hypothetical protein